MFGYGKGTDGQLYIIPEEAEVVRLIYGKYLEGKSLNSIARILKEKGIKTIRGNTEWNVNSIRTILINEKYIGDTMTQKTFTTDYLTRHGKRIKGNFKSIMWKMPMKQLYQERYSIKFKKNCTSEPIYIRNQVNRKQNPRASIAENTPYPRLPFAKNAAVSTADKSGLSMGKRKQYGDVKTG